MSENIQPDQSERGTNQDKNEGMIYRVTDSLQESSILEETGAPVREREIPPAVLEGVVEKIIGIYRNICKTADQHFHEKSVRKRLLLHLRAKLNYWRWQKHWNVFENLTAGELSLSALTHESLFKLLELPAVSPEDEFEIDISGGIEKIKKKINTSENLSILYDKMQSVNSDTIHALTLYATLLKIPSNQLRDTASKEIFEEQIRKLLDTIGTIFTSVIVSLEKRLKMSSAEEAEEIWNTSRYYFQTLLVFCIKNSSLDPEGTKKIINAVEVLQNFQTKDAADRNFIRKSLDMELYQKEATSRVTFKLLLSTLGFSDHEVVDMLGFWETKNLLESEEIRVQLYSIINNLEHTHNGIIHRLYKLGVKDLVHTFKDLSIGTEEGKAAFRLLEFGFSQAEVENMFRWWKKSNPSIWDTKRGLSSFQLNMKTIEDYEERSPGICRTMLIARGIKNFLRYPLETLLADIDPVNKHKPYGIVIFPQSDHNGAFTTYRKTIFTKLREEFGEKVIVRVVECQSKREILVRVGRLTDEHSKNDIGDVVNPVKFVIIGGHGNHHSVQLGSEDSTNNFIGLEDLASIDPTMIKIFEPKMPVVFVACSSGVKKGIAEETSRLGFTVMGPEEESGLSSLRPSLDRQGKVHFSPQFKKRSERKPERIARVKVGKYVG